MRWLLPLLLASLAVLALSLGSAGARSSPDAGEMGGSVRLPLLVPRVSCERPATLRLRRFEDRSAQLLCANRVVVRISVPG